MIKALIFDFDGLIIDTELPEFESWREIYAEYGCTLDLATWAIGIGTADAFDPYDHLEKCTGIRIERDELRKRRWERNKELLREQTVCPGVIDYLNSAKDMGLKTAIASSSPRKWVVEYLPNELIPYFNCFKTREDVAKVKPDPALYLAVLHELKVNASEAVAFEDSPNGIAAARAAGIFCVAVPNELTKELALDEANLIINSLSKMKLPDILKYYRLLNYHR